MLIEGEKMQLSKYENKINEITSEILKLEKNVNRNLEHIGNRFKELGDRYINYFIELYLIHNEINNSLVDLSFSNYKKSNNLFLKNNFDVKYIYTLMAWGNAYKESFLPSMNKNDFIQLYNKAKEKYKKGINLYFAKDKLFVKEYHFLMLEQINLEIRKKVWKLDLLPKRVNIFHSLKSPISHAILEGLCYYSYLYNIEIWEYRYGEVRTFDEEKKFIKDRLKETSAVIFLLSENYSKDRPIIRFEVDKVCKMLEKNDPLQVFGVDLGNQNLVEELLSKDIKIYKIKEIQKIFQENSKYVNDIYRCRKFRINDVN